MEEKRSSFTGKLGFVLAAAGSAVGLGNIWRFPYLAAKYGGGIFLLVYIALALTFGSALMITEIAIGRRTGLSPIGAFRKLNEKFSFLGILASIVPIIILPYYSVIGGWVIKYAAGFVTGHGEAMSSDGYFSAFTGSVAEPLIWFALFIGITALVVLLGVNKGIEKVSKVMMPTLIVLVIFIALYSLFSVDGATEGALYYILPDFSKFSMMTVVAAMGQLFYSMSLAMGVMITFGSYMKKDISIKASARQIEFFDSLVAFLSGLMIVPAVFAFGGETALGESGPSLMFVTLPKIFASMPGGGVIGAAFFIMIFFAALTSAISLMETAVSTMLDKLKLDRRVCCLIVLGFCLCLGTVSSLGYSLWNGFTVIGMTLLDLFDFVSNSLIMPIVALLTCIFVGYFLGTKPIAEELELSGSFKHRRLYDAMIRYVAPVCILVILISSALGAFGVISI